MSSNDLYRVLPEQPQQLLKVSYLKKLQKRHKNAWAVTFQALVSKIERIDALLQTQQAATLKASNGHRLVKVEFTIAGSKKSTKASGHRSIVYIDNCSATAKIVMAYHKKDLKSPRSETAEIMAHIKAAYPEIASLFNL